MSWLRVLILAYAALVVFGVYACAVKHLDTVQSNAEITGSGRTW